VRAPLEQGQIRLSCQIPCNLPSLLCMQRPAVAAPDQAPLAARRFPHLTSCSRGPAAAAGPDQAPCPHPCNVSFTPVHASVLVHAPVYGSARVVLLAWPAQGGCLIWCAM
jgi:hypothetical protein